MQIDQTFGQIVAADQLALNGYDLVFVHRHRNADLAGRALQASHMRLAVDELAFQHGGHFVNTVTEQEATVKDGNARIVGGDIFAVDIDDAVFEFFC